MCLGRITVKTLITEFVRFLVSPDLSLAGRMLICGLVGAAVGGVISLGSRRGRVDADAVKALLSWGVAGWFLGLFIQYAISEMRSFD